MFLIDASMASRPLAHGPLMSKGTLAYLVTRPARPAGSTEVVPLKLRAPDVELKQHDRGGRRREQTTDPTTPTKTSNNVPILFCNISSSSSSSFSSQNVHHVSTNRQSARVRSSVRCFRRGCSRGHARRAAHCHGPLVVGWGRSPWRGWQRLLARNAGHILRPGALARGFAHLMHWPDSGRGRLRAPRAIQKGC